MQIKMRYPAMAAVVFATAASRAAPAWAQASVTVQPVVSPPQVVVSPPQVVVSPPPQVVVSPPPQVVVSPAAPAVVSNGYNHDGFRLMASGATIFGVSYLGTVLAAGIVGDVCNAQGSLGCNDQNWPLYVPLVGPFVQMGSIHGDGANTGRALLLIDGIVQIGGAAMFVVGAAIATTSRSAPAYASRFQLAPFTARSGSGLMAMGSF